MSWFSSWASLSLPSSTPTVDVLSYTVLAAGFPPETVDKTRKLGVKLKFDNTAVYAETSDAMHKSFCAGAEWHHGFGGTYIEVGTSPVCIASPGRDIWNQHKTSLGRSTMVDWPASTRLNSISSSEP